MPTRFLISTVRRHTPPEEPSGYIYLVDYAARQVVQRCSIIEPAFREEDDNPRGGMRGGKGISVRPDQIALANFSRIVRYDPQWNILGEISHPSCAGIHDILYEGDTLWVASARTDSLFQFDLQGKILRHIYLRDRSPILKTLGWDAPRLLDADGMRRGATDFRDPRTHEKETYDRAHVNSLVILSNGDLLVSMGYVFGEQTAALLRWKIGLTKLGVWPLLKKANAVLRRLSGKKEKNMDNALVVRPASAQSAIVRITPDDKRSVCLSFSGMTAPSHSLLLLADGTGIYLDTTNGAVLHFDPAGGRILSSTVVTDGFLRGGTLLDEHTLLLGSRGELITFHLPSLQVLGRLPISADPKEAVYDIKRLPEHYALPPLSFDEQWGRSS